MCLHFFIKSNKSFLIRPLNYLVVFLVYKDIYFVYACDVFFLFFCDLAEQEIIT